VFDCLLLLRRRSWVVASRRSRSGAVRARDPAFGWLEGSVPGARAVRSVRRVAQLARRVLRSVWSVRHTKRSPGTLPGLRSLGGSSVGGRGHSSGVGADRERGPSGRRGHLRSSHPRAAV